MSISRNRIDVNRTKNARILIIEDDLDHQLLIKNALQQSFTGAEAVIKSTEQEAIHYLDECIQTGRRLPHFILLDLYLPEREDAWHTLKEIQNRSVEIGNIPVVVFSSSSHSEDISESYDRGATSYIVKPVGFTEWIDYFRTLKDYWWETAILPGNH
ncbi:response regulator [Larkinella bovis]|uniref:Response regulator n=1 Tax=Larkinella bovis TaxID=683041 RepID=A0ABW0IKG1_9BACT